jgi:hypothetical protein
VGRGEVLDLPLQIRIRHRWRATLIRAREGRTTLPAELHAGGILVLAPRTLHAGSLPASEAGNGRTGDESLVSGIRRVNPVPCLGSPDRCRVTTKDPCVSRDATLSYS